MMQLWMEALSAEIYELCLAPEMRRDKKFFISRGEATMRADFAGGKFSIKFHS